MRFRVTLPTTAPPPARTLSGGGSLLSIRNCFLASTMLVASLQAHALNRFFLSAGVPKVELTAHESLRASSLISWISGGSSEGGTWG